MMPERRVGNALTERGDMVSGATVADVDASVLPPSPAGVHFVGIGGSGVSGLARILQPWGYDVGGDGCLASEQTELLAARGIPV